jgi:formate hydrogenlyase transcriptional activator
MALPASAPLPGGDKRLRLLLEINNALVSTLKLDDLFRAISVALQRVVRHDYCSLSLYDPKLDKLRVHARDFPGGAPLAEKVITFHIEGSPAGETFKQRRALRVDDLNERRFPSDSTRRLLAEGIRSACWVPLVHGARCIGVLCLGTRRPSVLCEEAQGLLCEVAGQVTIAVENALAFQEIKELKDQLAKEKNYLEGEIRANYDSEEMVGDSPEWRRVLEAVATVAPTDATVLILGETGTGKELIARAIHERSHRRERTLVKLNCSAVPTGLLESELFGHERGAFTGAITQQIGRFELAHKGTLLLDEIGDIPLELQPKLLRALQEQQFERLGNARTVKVDVRLMAATNRNLAELVSERRFRDDLYYRLNVFPVLVPPLRDRRQDIPSLVHYFIHKHAGKMRRHIEMVPPDVMERLKRWDWPGNVRELENFVERAVILSTDGTLRIPAGEWQEPAQPEATTLQDAEREFIVKALRESAGVVGGAVGAAARLGMKRTTLNSRLRKLGIVRSAL